MTANPTGTDRDLRKPVPTFAKGQRVRIMDTIWANSMSLANVKGQVEATYQHGVAVWVPNPNDPQELVIVEVPPSNLMSLEE